MVCLTTLQSIRVTAIARHIATVDSPSALAPGISVNRVGEVVCVWGDEIRLSIIYLR
jgi:hypothetical protein